MYDRLSKIIIIWLATIEIFVAYVQQWTSFSWFDDDDEIVSLEGKNLPTFFLLIAIQGR